MRDTLGSIIFIQPLCVTLFTNLFAILQINSVLSYFNKLRFHRFCPLIILKLLYSFALKRQFFYLFYQLRQKPFNFQLISNEDVHVFQDAFLRSFFFLVDNHKYEPHHRTILRLALSIQKFLLFLYILLI